MRLITCTVALNFDACCMNKPIPDNRMCTKSINLHKQTDSCNDNHLSLLVNIKQTIPMLKVRLAACLKMICGRLYELHAFQNM